MKRPDRIAMGIAALILTACGAQPAATAVQNLVAGAQCPHTYFLNPVWTPDGGSIVYDSGQVVIDIHQMRADPGGTGSGSDDRLLVGDARLVAVSPDGANLLYSRRSKTNNTQYDLYLLDFASNESRLLAEAGNQGSWSPDGEWVAHEDGPPERGQIALSDAAGTETDLLPGSQPGVAARDSAPLWSPGPGAAGDGAWIAFNSKFEKKTRVYIAGADGTLPAAIAPPDDGRCAAPRVENDSVLAWRPDGGAVAVMRSCEGNIGVWVAGISGTQIADWPDIKATQLEWSPDGSQILFTQNDGTADSLYIAQGDGSGVRLLRANARDGRWSPDGTRIVFSGQSGRGGPQDIYVINAAGSGEKRLTANPATTGVCLP